MDEGGRKDLSKDELKEKLRHILHPPGVELEFNFKK